MHRLIEAARRTGCLLDLVPGYLSKAENKSNTSDQRMIRDVQLLYCKGIFYFYTGRTEVTVRLFSAVRTDKQLGTSALSKLVEICVNPDNETLGGEALDGRQVEQIDPMNASIKTAEKFLMVSSSLNELFMNENFLNIHLNILDGIRNSSK